MQLCSETRPPGQQPPEIRVPVEQRTLLAHAAPQALVLLWHSQHRYFRKPDKELQQVQHQTQAHDPQEELGDLHRLQHL